MAVFLYRRQRISTLYRLWVGCKLVYEQYPYYAINSCIATSIMGAEGMTRIEAEKEGLRQTGQMLFTIGYEGISIEQYLYSLIRNDIRVLCDEGKLF